MHEAKLSVLHPEQVRIGCACHAAGAAGAKSTPDHYRADHFVHHEAAVGNVHASRQAGFAGIRVGSLCRGHAAFDSHARIAPRNQVSLPLQEGVKVGGGPAHQLGVGIAPVGRDGPPILFRRILQVVIGVEQPLPRRSRNQFDLGDLVVIDAQPHADHIGIGLVCHNDLGEGLARGVVIQAHAPVDDERFGDQAGLDVGGLHVLLVAEAVGKRQNGDVALGLRGQVEPDGVLQAAALAGDHRNLRGLHSRSRIPWFWCLSLWHLCMSQRGDQHRGAERDAHRD